MLRLKSNGEAVVGRLGRLASRITDPGPILREFGDYMVNTSVRQNFEAEGRPTPWPRSAWSAQRQQNRSGGAGLVGSIAAQVTGRKLEVGSPLKYAAQRQYGGELKPTSSRALAVPMPDVPASMDRPRRWGNRLFRLPADRSDPNSRGLLAVDGPGGEPRVVFALRARVRQPARPFLLWHPEDLAWISRAVVRHAFEEQRP